MSDLEQGFGNALLFVLFGLSFVDCPKGTSHGTGPVETGGG
jgi:hypothetical protein